MDPSPSAKLIVQAYLLQDNFIFLDPSVELPVLVFDVHCLTKEMFRFHGNLFRIGDSLLSVDTDVVRKTTKARCNDELELPVSLLEFVHTLK